MAGIPDCCLYESQAIVEWLDEMPFDASLLVEGAAHPPPMLYPQDPLDKIEAKMWQYWELSLAEEFWPLSRQQVDGTIWRWTYNREQVDHSPTCRPRSAPVSYIALLPQAPFLPSRHHPLQFDAKKKAWSNGDPFYEAKVTKMYELSLIHI